MRLQTAGSQYIMVAGNHEDLALRYIEAMWARRRARGRGWEDERPWMEWPLRKKLNYVAESQGGGLRSDTAKHIFEDMVAKDQARWVPADLMCVRTTDEDYIASPDPEDMVKQFCAVRWNNMQELSIPDWMKAHAKGVMETARRHKEHPESPLVDTNGHRLDIDALGGRDVRSDTAGNFIEDLIAVGDLMRMDDVPPFMT